MNRKRLLYIGIFLFMVGLAVPVVHLIFLHMEDQKLEESMPSIEPESRLENETMETPKEPEEEKQSQEKEAVEKEMTEEEKYKLENLKGLAEQNTDLVGWLSIADTGIDYPVMQTEDDYYLNHNFNKQENAYGLPYLSKYCDLDKPSDNLIIYGHNIKNGKMFGALLQYESQDFYEKHSVIQFDTLTECRQYEIIAVFKASIEPGSKNEFQYYRFIDASNEEIYNKFIEAAKKASLYPIDKTAGYGEKLLTLSTCDNVSDEGRFVILAKYIEPERMEKPLENESMTNR